MKKILLPIITTVILGLGSDTYAWESDQCQHRAKHQQHHGKKDGEGFFERLRQQLELTDEQSKALKALHQQAHDNKPQRLNTRARLMQLDPKASNYSQDVATLAQTAANDAKARVLKQAEIQQKIYAQLTPAQQQKLREITAQKFACNDK